LTGLIILALCLASGIFLGIIYFGGLWLTIRHLASAHHPEILALGSFICRSAVCILGFYMVLGAGFEGLASSLAGFILAKAALVRRWGLADSDTGRVVD
jgi:F1F0 ATPase subunit 2